MSTPITPHSERARVLGEVHARPFEALPTPRLVRHLALITSGEQARALHKAVALAATEAGATPPTEQTRYYVLNAFGGRLRWEQHSEFGALTWDAPPDNPQDGISLVIARADAPIGEMIAKIEIEVCDQTNAPDFNAQYDDRSLSISAVEDGIAVVATDFRQSENGATRMSVVNHGASDIAIGGVVQRLIEVETYRTLALLGLPLAQRTGPVINQIEHDLVVITNALREAPETGSERLLDDITKLSADLEANAASCLFRFGASKAYHEIVRLRLSALREASYQHYPTLESFLLRRLQPAMQTIHALEQRQANLSRKLSRAANLLRTRVDVELERQNRDLLQSMNRRAKLQLRLQQTVEGLSIAAVSYYVVGLLNYMLKGAEKSLPSPFGINLSAPLMTAILVPVVVLILWFMVRRLRKSHRD